MFQCAIHWQITLHDKGIKYQRQTGKSTPAPRIQGLFVCLSVQLSVIEDQQKRFDLEIQDADCMYGLSHACHAVNELPAICTIYIV